MHLLRRPAQLQQMKTPQSAFNQAFFATCVSYMQTPATGSVISVTKALGVSATTV